MITHPPHIISGENSLSPSAFIPFCSFAGSLAVVGQTIPNFSIPVCNKFEPTVLRGQLCYQVDTNKLTDQVDLKKLMTQGLIFLLDYNENRQGQDLSRENDNIVVEEDLGEMRDQDNSRKEAMIYIETLGV